MGGTAWGQIARTQQLVDLTVDLIVLAAQEGFYWV